MPQTRTPIVAVRSVLVFLGVAKLPAIRIADTIRKQPRLGVKSELWSRIVPLGEHAGIQKKNNSQNCHIVMVRVVYKV
jgi:hypothetical protein